MLGVVVAELVVCGEALEFSAALAFGELVEFGEVLEFGELVWPPPLLLMLEVPKVFPALEWMTVWGKDVPLPGVAKCGTRVCVDGVTTTGLILLAKTAAGEERPTDNAKSATVDRFGNRFVRIPQYSSFTEQFLI